MNKLYVGVLNRLFNTDGPDWVYDDPSNYTISKVPVSPWNAGTKGEGLTTCPKHQKEINRQMMIKRYKNGLDMSGSNNPRSKTWRIVYDDGREIIIQALQKWCAENGYNRCGMRKVINKQWKKYRDIVAVEEVSQGG